MRRRALEFLVCPGCQEELRPSVASGDGDEIIEGHLLCPGCGHTYPVIRGIPRFAQSRPASRRVRRMQKRFGWQARRFQNRGFDPASSRTALRSFVAPLGQADFEGAVVMEAGCGTGRWAIAAARWGARDVLAVDFSDAVEATHDNARGLHNVHVIQADLHQLPLRRGGAGQVDLAVSIGVLHHLEAPARGLRALTEITRPGGTVFSWVYAAEGNEWLARYVDPVRSGITSRLPLPVVSGLALVVTAALHPLAKLAARGRSRAIPYRPYLEWLAAMPRSHTHAVVHDHLAAPLARYVTRGEFERWFRESGLGELRIFHRNANSWSGVARRGLGTGACP